MDSMRAGGVALLSLALAVQGTACGGPAYYAEYALAEGAPPESIQCYDSCMRSTHAESRQACFAHCDGVVAKKTVRPCEQEGHERCSWQALAQPSGSEATDEHDEASNESVGGAVIGALFDLLVFAATSPPEKRTRRVEHVHEAQKSPPPRIPARPRRGAESDRADAWKARGSVR